MQLGTGGILRKVEVLIVAFNVIAYGKVSSRLVQKQSTEDQLTWLHVLQGRYLYAHASIGQVSVSILIVTT